MCFLDEFHDGDTFTEAVSVDDERGDTAHGVQFFVIIFVLLPTLLQKVDRDIVIVDALPLKGVSNSPGGA